MTGLLIMAAALLPALGIETVSLRSLRRVRDAWLWGLLVLATAWAGWHEPWLGVIGLYLCGWWLLPTALDPLRRAPYQRLPTVLTWVGIGATWFIGRALPPEAWGWIVPAWGAWAWLASGAMVWERSRREWVKVRGGYGTRSVTGAFLALVLPLLPWWAWPGPLVGLWLSGPSWLAVLAVGVSLGMLHPGWASWGLLAALGGILALTVGLRMRVFGRAIGEWTPRGDSLDSLRHRWLLLRLAWADRPGWCGVGPGATTGRHMRAGCREGSPLATTEVTGTLHNEPAQLAYEYGVFGVAAGLLFMWRAGTGLTLGDPISAAVVAGAVLACGTMALRVAPIGLMWLLMAAEVAR